MTRLLEDILTEVEIDAIDAVLTSYELRFDRLVRLAGLDAAEDFQFSDLRGLNFCGADLRGFNFAGSDLREVLVDRRTIMDDTTNLTDARINWLHEQDIPIVEAMNSILSALTGDGRRAALLDLERRFGKTEHVVRFVVNAAVEADSFDAFLDYMDFLPVSLSEDQLTALVRAGERQLKSRLSKARSRTRRNTTTVFTYSAIAERLAEAKGSLAERWFQQIAEAADERGRTAALKGTVGDFGQDELISGLKRLTGSSGDRP